MRNVVLPALAATTLGACTTTGQNASFLPAAVGSSSTAAVQALQDGAFSVDPTHGASIATPGIYKFYSNGSADPICENDMQIAAIKAMTVTPPRASDDSLEDNLAATNWSISVPGVGTITAPYKKIKVEDYTVTHLVSGDSGPAADFILAHVGKDCRETVLPRNVPYLVVTDVAIAKKAFTMSKGAFQAAFAAGPASLSWSNPEIKSTTRTNVVFAVRGKLVEAKPQKKAFKKKK